MDLEVICLGENDEKKHALEKNIKYVFEKLGWSVDQNITEKSSEFDLLCSFNLNSNIKFVVESKAHKKKIQMSDIRIMAGKLHEQKINGIIIALNGFVANAKQIVDNKYPQLQLMDGIEYNKFLLKSEFIKNFQDILSNFRIQGKNVREIKFIINQDKMYWLILFENYYILQTSQNEEISADDLEYILSRYSELKKYHKIQPIKPEAILISLAEEKKNSSRLQKEFNIPREVIQFYLEDFEKREFVANFNGIYDLQPNSIKIMREIINYLPNLDSLCLFMRTPFYDRYLERNLDQLLHDFDKEPKIREIMSIFLYISPSVCKEIHMQSFDPIFSLKKNLARCALKIYEDIEIERFSLYKMRQTVAVFQPPKITVATDQKMLLEFIPDQYTNRTIALLRTKPHNGIHKDARLYAADDLVTYNLSEAYWNAKYPNICKEILLDDFKIEKQKGTYGYFLKAISFLEKFPNDEKYMQIYEELKGEINKLDSDLPPTFSTEKKEKIEDNMKKVKQILKNHPKN